MEEHCQNVCWCVGMLQHRGRLLLLLCIQTQLKQQVVPRRTYSKGHLSPPLCLFRSYTIHRPYHRSPSRMPPEGKVRSCARFPRPLNRSPSVGRPCCCIDIHENQSTKEGNLINTRTSGGIIALQVVFVNYLSTVFATHFHHFSGEDLLPFNSLKYLEFI